MVSYDLDFCSVEQFENSLVVFSTPSSSVFREDDRIVPLHVDDDVEIMPWGGDNLMPYRIIDLVEQDETVSTCQEFQSEVCYGSGLQYDCTEAAPGIAADVDEFLVDNNLPAYFLGVAKDFKYFGFAVSVIILNADNSRIVRILRKEACYCRFSPIDERGAIPYIVYANWRLGFAQTYEVIPLLDMNSPWSDLQEKVRKNPNVHKYAVVSKIPTVDSTYYPIPYYASLFRGKWYDIKQKIGAAKEAKLRNSASLKYHIEISQKFWDAFIKDTGLTDKVKIQEAINRHKKDIIDFLTSAENSGKALFSQFYVSPDGKENSEIKISKIDSAKEGGDWESDIQEAVNMICFTMRVHSNLVGSVPGKSQSNNSGSDKRELYTIAHALQKPYHDILFGVHRIIIKFNRWLGVKPVCPFVMLTTLDEHKDAKTVTVESPQNPQNQQSNGRQNRQ